VKVSTPERIAKFREVIQTTTTPSHVGSVPNNFGSAAVGTPKAEEWRKVFTIFLPLALITMFGLGEISVLNRTEVALRNILNHSMQLVCAIRLACRRVTSQRRMRLYREHLVNYIWDLGVLFPGLDHESIHHMSFHLYEFLELFGPVHSWWCFPFERLIGQLQRLPTNHLFGGCSRLYNE
jgi:hypothetical protein